MRDRASYLLTDLMGGEDQRPDTRLIALAHRVQRLAPDHRDPEKFHEDKSEIVAELRRLVREGRNYG